ncbi:MAG: MarR family transcriptional regulator [Propionicimonas sp.]
MDEDPPWLNHEEQRVWLQLSLLMTRLPAALERQLQRDAGLSLYEYLLLSGLSMAPHRRLRLRDLADFSGTSLSRLSNVVRKLEDQGWLARVPDPQDGRSTFAVLTEPGYARVVEAAPGHVREVRRLIFDPLSTGQLRRLGEATRRMLDVVDPEGCDPDALLRGADDTGYAEAGPATTASTASP